MDIKMGYYSGIRQDLDNIYNALMDEESKEWFDARVEYMITRNEDLFFDSLFRIAKKYPHKWQHLGMERFIKNKYYNGLIIYGCGHDGKLIKEVLDLCGYTITCWCDSNESLWGNNLCGLEIISPDELIEKHKNCLIVIGSMGGYKGLIWEHLRAIGFPLENVVIFDENTITWATRGNQYFDVFTADNKEIFVDVGAYNGDTIFDFLEWSRGKESKVYSLEPLKHMCKFINSRLKAHNISGIEVLNCAAWNRKEQLEFRDSGDWSSITKTDGSSIVSGDTIDNIVEHDKVTFIKLDVEGTELEALKGASETIHRYHPKLAICIYHKPLDILEIGKYILNINPKYKLYIRHYTSTMYETVLYAIP